MNQNPPSAAPSSPRVSFIIPCFNAEKTIDLALDKLQAYLGENSGWIGSAEVIAVDDGSTDGTAALIVQRFPDVRLLSHPHNLGKGAAVRTGMLAARGAYRFFMDADLPYDLGALRTMLRYLDFKEFDLCIGSRDHSASMFKVKRSRLRRFASFMFTELVSRVVTTGIRDTQCGFKGFRGAAADYLFGQSRVDNFAFDVEVLYLAFKNDLDIKRVPVELVEDDFSTVSVFRHGLGMLFETLKLPLRYHTGQYQLMEKAGQERPA